MGAGAVFVKTISSVLSVQVPLLTVHRRVALVPAAIPVTVVLASVAFVIVAVPDTRFQTPVPFTGGVALKEKILVLHCSISVPAAAAEGNA